MEKQGPCLLIGEGRTVTKNRSRTWSSRQEQHLGRRKVVRMPMGVLQTEGSRFTGSLMSLEMSEITLNLPPGKQHCQSHLGELTKSSGF